MESHAKNEPLTVILFGSAGSGKGTQGDFLISKLQLVPVVAGELVREVAKRNDDLGRTVREIIDSGRLLPDELFSNIVEQSIRAVSLARGVLIDGYPRRVTQAKLLETWLAAMGRHRVKVLYIRLSGDEAKRRLRDRSMCVNGHILIGRHHAVCPIDGAAIQVRADDQDEAAIDKRLERYREETLPAIEYYRQKEWVVEVNGEQTVEEVRKEIFKKLGIQ